MNKPDKNILTLNLSLEVFELWTKKVNEYKEVNQKITLEEIFKDLLN
jgi:hypothetical protein